RPRSLALWRVLTNRMREYFTYGSVGGAGGNPGSYPAPKDEERGEPQVPLRASLARSSSSVSFALGRSTMPRTFEQIIEGLAALNAEDFDYHTPGFDGHEQLHELTEELMALPQPERAIRALFDVMERMPDADLGSPGPLVHTLERMLGHYEREL